jgi:hypothetical protein
MDCRGIAALAISQLITAVAAIFFVATVGRERRPAVGAGVYARTGPSNAACGGASRPSAMARLTRATKRSFIKCRASKLHPPATSSPGSYVLASPGEVRLTSDMVPSAEMSVRNEGGQPTRGGGELARRGDRWHNLTCRSSLPGASGWWIGGAHLRPPLRRPGEDVTTRARPFSFLDKTVPALANRIFCAPKYNRNP